MAKPKPTKMLAVLGRCQRTGRWRLAARSSVLAVLGTCRLDMRHSFVDDGERLKMKVTVFLGSATFILPDGAIVRPSGISVLSTSTVDVPEHEDDAALPTLDIEWTSIFGRLRVLSDGAYQASLMGDAAPAEVAEGTDSLAADPAGASSAAGPVVDEVSASSVPVVDEVSASSVPVVDEVSASSVPAALAGAPTPEDDRAATEPVG